MCYSHCVPLYMNHQTLLRYIFASILSLLAYSATAQTMTAKVTPVAGYYRLTFTISSSDVTDFRPPSLNAFKLLSGPSKSSISNTTIVNGHVTHEDQVCYTYIITPKQEGDIRIGSASAMAEGRRIQSKPITLKGAAIKNNQAAAPQEEEQAVGTPITHKDLFIDMTVSKRRVMEQEAFLVTYRLHAKSGVMVNSTELVSKPDFKGVIAQELGDPTAQKQADIENRNGHSYRVATLQQYLLMPQQSGEITIPGITYKVTVIQQDKSLSPLDIFFNGGGRVGVEVNRTVADKTIKVDALPSPRPSTFTNAVGTFQLEGKLLGGTPHTGDMAVYRVTLRGNGNMKLITPPVCIFPKDFDAIAPKQTDKTHATTSGITGEIYYDYQFVPQNVGDYTIPPVVFTYYDLQQGRYVTLETEPTSFHVAKGTRKANATSYTNQTIQPTLAADTIATSPSSIFVPGWRHLATLAILLSLYWALRLAYRFYAQKRGTWFADTKACRKMKQRLDHCQSLLQDASPTTREAFYQEVHHMLTEALLDRYHIQASSCAKEEIQQALQQAGLSEETASEYTQLISLCEYARFAPQTSMPDTEMMQRVRTLLLGASSH